jgi:hypothetical protein
LNHPSCGLRGSGVDLIVAREASVDMLLVCSVVKRRI